MKGKHQHKGAIAIINNTYKTCWNIITERDSFYCRWTSESVKREVSKKVYDNTFKILY